MTVLKVEVDKLEINKLVNVPTSLDNLKTNVDELDVGKLKTDPIDFKKLKSVVDKNVVNKKWKTKVQKAKFKIK